MNKLFITFLFIGISFSIFSQSGTSLWTGLTIEKNISKKFDISLGIQARMPENMTYLQTYFGEIGFAFKPTKKLEFAGYYRLINKRKNETKDWKNRHRFYFDLTFQEKFKKIKFENRLRYQHQFKDNDGEIEFDASYLRNKVELSFPNKSKFIPYISTDIFYKIGYKTDQLRPKIGLNYKLNKKSSFEISLFKNIDLIDKIKTGPIVGFGYKLKL